MDFHRQNGKFLIKMIQMVFNNDIYTNKKSDNDSYYKVRKKDCHIIVNFSTGLFVGLISHYLDLVTCFRVYVVKHINVELFIYV